ncbi:MAG: glycosyltransferase family 2 protein [Nitrospinota bacterium]|nr:MAG: glycosyltransferase family 2 protein [Nitrospinota bacterium]
MFRKGLPPSIPTRGSSIFLPIGKRSQYKRIPALSKPPPAPKISVVVCTYNRVDLLTEALHSLCDQALPACCYEIVVVDNNSRDNTREVVEGLGRHHPHLRYVLEREQGLSAARNRGWQEAHGEYVAYIDDDCKVPKQWLTVASAVIEKVHPAVFGGPFRAFYKQTPPPWFRDAYGSYDLGSEARVLTRRFLFGGNIFFSRKLLTELDGFDATLGMQGQQLGYGEEIAPQLYLRTHRPEQVIYYEPRLYVYHLVRPEKMRLRWIAYQRFVQGGYTYRLFEKPVSPEMRQGRLLKQAGKVLLRLSLELTRGVSRRDRKRYPYAQNYLYEEAFQHVATLGRLYEQYRQCR